MFKKKKKPESVEDVVKILNRLGESLNSANERIERLETEDKNVIKNVGLVRYDAYSEAGGRQSFSLALLNDKGDGVVVTGLFKEGSTRVFTKGVENSKAESALSPEEENAINNAGL